MISRISRTALVFSALFVLSLFFAHTSVSALKDYPWDQNGGKTSAGVSMVEFDGSLYQVIRGNSAPYHIWMRSTADGVFDGSDASENWDREAISGKTSAQPTLAVYDGRLYLAVRGNSGNIFTKSMGTDGEWDDTWNENGGATGTAIGMASVDFGDGKEERLYQVIRGRSTNYIYVRYTLDGTFDGGEGEEWEKIWGKTPNAIGVTAMNGNLYMSVRGNSGEIWNRYTNDGVWDGDEAGENFVQNGGMTSIAPALAADEVNGVVYQAVKGNSTDLIYTRATRDGEEWSGWIEMGGETQTRVGMVEYDGKMWQMVRGNSGEMFTREFPHYKQATVTLSGLSFSYFNLPGTVYSDYSSDNCSNGYDGEEFQIGSIGLSVNTICGYGNSGGGDEIQVEVIKSGTLLTKDGKSFNYSMTKSELGIYYVSAVYLDDSTGVIVDISNRAPIASMSEANQVESLMRVILSSMTYSI